MQNLSREVSKHASKIGVINLEPGDIVVLWIVLSKIFVEVHSVCLKKHCVTVSIKCTYFLKAQKSLLSKASYKTKFRLSS